jgi:NAD(P)-dependent dehydrogenase (short-subunit alcohol dehydrogenase family)
MPTENQARSLNDSYSPLSTPTAIFVGGTSGIGRAMAESFARATKGNCSIILIGRNRTAAESIIASFPKPTTTDVHEFVECDAKLIQNVHATTSALLQRLQKVNFLVLSPGMFRASGRHDTTEGIDEQLALMYHARWTFTYDLMPLLTKAAEAGEDAKVMTVLAAGTPIGVQADVNDLEMKKSWIGAMRVASTYNDLMFEVCFPGSHGDVRKLINISLRNSLH